MHSDARIEASVPGGIWSDNDTFVAAFSKTGLMFGREFAQGGIEKKELGFVVFGWADGVRLRSR